MANFFNTTIWFLQRGYKTCHKKCTLIQPASIQQMLPILRCDSSTTDYPAPGLLIKSLSKWYCKGTIFLSADVFDCCGLQQCADITTDILFYTVTVQHWCRLEPLPPNLNVYSTVPWVVEKCCRQCWIHVIFGQRGFRVSQPAIWFWIFENRVENPVSKSRINVALQDMKTWILKILILSWIHVELS